MSESGFKINDWVFHNFSLAQVREVEDGRVVHVDDGYGTTGGQHLACVPLTLRNKRISGEYELHYKRLHKEGTTGLNYPDIHRWLVEDWLEACNGPDVLIEMHYQRVQQFTRDILDKTGIDSGYGFPLLRRR